MKSILSAVCVAALALSGPAAALAQGHGHHGGGGHGHHGGGGHGRHGGDGHGHRHGGGFGRHGFGGHGGFGGRHGGFGHRGFHGYGGRHWRHHHWHGGYYGGGYYNDGGSSLAAGALGFVLGTAIADSQAHQAYAREHLRDQDWLNHCEARYRSFDPASGTYLGYDGRRHYCQ